MCLLSQEIVRYGIQVQYVFQNMFLRKGFGHPTLKDHLTVDYFKQYL
jgi:hypothetical protein